MRFKRPDFFRVKGENKKYPEYIELRPKPPAMFDHLPLEEVISYFEKRIEEIPICQITLLSRWSKSKQVKLHTSIVYQPGQALPSVAVYLLILGSTCPLF